MLLQCYAHTCRPKSLLCCSMFVFIMTACVWGGGGGFETQLFPVWVIIPAACYASSLNHTGS